MIGLTDSGHSKEQVQGQTSSSSSDNKFERSGTPFYVADIPQLPKLPGLFAKVPDNLTMFKE